MRIGDEVLRLIASAVDRAMIIAPFAKAEVFQTILDACHEGVEMTCVTRWRPEEVARGISDLEVHDLVEARPNTTLRLCHNLHGKLYQADDASLVGSANVSASGFGWCGHPSLELLVKVPASEPAVRAFVKRALVSSVLASPELRSEMADLAQEFADGRSELGRLQVLGGGPQTHTLRWLPWCKAASEVFTVYAGSWPEVTKSAVEDAFRDLEFLEIPTGLTAHEFRLLVRSRLLVHPIFAKARAEGVPAVSKKDVAKLGIDPSAYSGIEEIRGILDEWIHYFF